MNRVFLCLAVGAWVCQMMPGAKSANAQIVYYQTSGNSSVSLASNAIQVPSRASPASAGKNSSWPPNSLTPKMKKWDRLLDQTYLDRFNDTLTTRELIQQLTELGIPTVLHYSAIDDSLSEEEPLELPLPHSPLRARLNATLNAYNATLLFRPHYVLIISQDDEYDVQYLMTVTYDVTALPMDKRVLVDLILESVHNESWLDTGQGLATITPVTSGQRDLLTICQTYSIHRQVQSMLSGMHGLTFGGVPVANRAVRMQGSRTGGSQPVVVPETLMRSVDGKVWRPSNGAKSNQAYGGGGFF